MVSMLFHSRAPETSYCTGEHSTRLFLQFLEEVGDRISPYGRQPREDIAHRNTPQSKSWLVLQLFLSLASEVYTICPLARYTSRAASSASSFRDYVCQSYHRFAPWRALREHRNPDFLSWQSVHRPRLFTRGQFGVRGWVLVLGWPASGVKRRVVAERLKGPICSSHRE